VADAKGPDCYTIRAAEGKYKGWYLGAKGRKTVLIEAPDEPPVFRIDKVGR